MDTQPLDSMISSSLASSVSAKTAQDQDTKNQLADSASAQDVSSVEPLAKQSAKPSVNAANPESDKPKP